MVEGSVPEPPLVSPTSDEESRLSVRGYREESLL